MSEPIDWATFAANPYRMDPDAKGSWRLDSSSSPPESSRCQHYKGAKTFCSYCGKKISSDRDEYPKCGAPTEQ